MFYRLAVGFLLAGSVMLVGGAEILAQACEDCGQTVEQCLPAEGFEVGCFDWKDHPDLGTGCSSGPMYCEPDFALNPDADITGMPAGSSLFTVPEVTASIWMRRDCDDAVLAFGFTTSELGRISRDSESIAL